MIRPPDKLRLNLPLQFFNHRKGVTKNMTKEEVALKIFLSLLEGKAQLSTSDIFAISYSESEQRRETILKAITKIYNDIYNGLEIKEENK